MNTKSKSIALLLVLCVFAVSAWAAPKPFTLTAAISGLPEGTKIKLVPGATHVSEDAAAEAVVQSGAFVLKGTVDGPRLFYIQVADSFGSYGVMLEPGKFSLIGAATEVQRGTSTGYEFNNMKLKGSKLQALYLKKRAPRNMLDSMYMANAATHKGVKEQRHAAMVRKDTVEAEAILKSEAWKKLEADENTFFATVNSTYSKMILDSKDSWWGPLMMLDLYSYYSEREKPIYAQFSKEAKDSYYGKVLNDILNPEGFKGKVAPLLDMKANNNAASDLASLLKGHKYVLVDFWASWCVPCRKSIPGLKKAYEELKDKGFQIVSVSIDAKEADWQKAEGEENFPWPSFLDNGKTSKAWKIRTIPATFLLNDKGVVVGENLTIAQIAEIMK